MFFTTFLHAIGFTEERGLVGDSDGEESDGDDSFHGARHSTGCDDGPRFLLELAASMDEAALHIPQARLVWRVFGGFLAALAAFGGFWRLLAGLRPAARRVDSPPPSPPPSRPRR